MRVIVCLDDRNGMLFHHRRQSRDQKVVEDIVKNFHRIAIKEFSKALFSDCMEAVVVYDQIRDTGEMPFFVEDDPLDVVEAEELYVYRWNRKYPGDVRLATDLTQYNKETIREFPGKSHDKITLEVYRRR